MKASVLRLMMGAVVAACVAGPINVQAKAPAVTMDTPAAPALNRVDQKIVAGMALANMAELEAARLALSKTASADVKAYAQQMVEDHTRALKDVTALAQNKGVTLPAGPDAKHKAMVKKLGKLDGAAFDKAYMAQAGVADHTKVHAALKKDHAKAKDPDVKALAAKMLPTVEQHLHAAHEKTAGK